jgi:hypothetical protein
MTNIETYTLNGEASIALVYNNNEIESTTVTFSESELIEWIEANGYNESTDDNLYRGEHNQHCTILNPVDCITNKLVLEFLNQ